MTTHAPWPPIVHYTHAARSGAARYVASLVAALARLGAHLTLICPIDFEYQSELCGLDSLRVEAALPSLSAGRNRADKAMRMGLQTLAGVRALRAARAMHPVVHVNFVLGAAPDVWCRLTGRRSVLTVHDVRPHRSLLPRSLERVEESLRRARYRLPDRLIVHTQAGADALTHRFGVPGDRVAIIPHGAFTLSDRPLPYQPGPEFHALLFGALREYKGVHLAIRAVQELRAAGAPLRLTIAGQPTASERAYWRDCLDLVHAKPCGIEIREGYVPVADVPALLAGHHVVLLPYTRFDSQSGVASLALANGRPIVATRVGGLAELLDPGVNGFPVEDVTVVATRNALAEVISAGHTRLEAMGRAAAKRYLAQHSWDTVAARHTELYMDLAVARRGR